MRKQIQRTIFFYERMIPLILWFSLFTTDVVECRNRRYFSRNCSFNWSSIIWSVLEKDSTLPERNREPRSIRSSAEKLHKVWCVLLLSINGIPKSFSFGILGSGQTSPQSKARHSLSSSLLQLLLRPLCADYKGDSNQCNGTSHTNPTKKERERVEKS